MDTADKLMQDGTWKEKKASALTEEDKDGTFRCRVCMAKAYPVLPCKESKIVNRHSE